MARPPLEISAEQVEDLAEKQWNSVEIAAHFDCSHDVITKRFANEYWRGKHNGIAKLKHIKMMAIKRLVEELDGDEAKNRIAAAATLMRLIKYDYEKERDVTPTTQTPGGPTIPTMMVQLEPGGPEIPLDQVKTILNQYK